jgi:hypothetical protein
MPNFPTDPENYKIGYVNVIDKDDGKDKLVLSDNNTYVLWELMPLGIEPGGGGITTTYYPRVAPLSIEWDIDGVKVFDLDSTKEVAGQKAFAFDLTTDIAGEVEHLISEIFDTTGISLQNLVIEEDLYGTIANEVELIYDILAIKSIPLAYYKYLNGIISKQIELQSSIEGISRVDALLLKELIGTKQITVEQLYKVAGSRDIRKIIAALLDI